LLGSKHADISVPQIFLVSGVRFLVSGDRGQLTDIRYQRSEDRAGKPLTRNS